MGFGAAELVPPFAGGVFGVRLGQSAEHLAEVLINPQVPLAIKDDQAGAGQVLCQPHSVQPRTAVLAAMPQQNRAGRRARLSTITVASGGRTGRRSRRATRCPP
jgi:hypothetical protein